MDSVEDKLIHQPVMLAEVISFLAPAPGKRFIDATVGVGRHGGAILQRCLPGGLLVGLDRDSCLLSLTRRFFLQKGFPRESWRLCHLSYINIDEAVEALGLSVGAFDGIFFDLGVASPQFDNAERGFSFGKPGPLDFRFDISQSLTGKEVVNNWSEKELRRIFREFGEEPHSARIARRICQVRQKSPIETTVQLAEIVRKAIPPRFRTTRRDPCTLIFQAIRIAVNDELSTLKEALPKSLQYLAVNGVCSVLSYHSGEDRIVKRCFRESARKNRDDPEFEILTKKPVLPSREEVRMNPRSRSGKLRVLRRCRLSVG
jgi:16S rRNA (cytosine1402-N4)-methyltransferase